MYRNLYVEMNDRSNVSNAELFAVKLVVFATMVTTVIKVNIKGQATHWMTTYVFMIR